jgi:hypothetical protein
MFLQITKFVFLMDFLGIDFVELKFRRHKIWKNKIMITFAP